MQSGSRRFRGHAAMLAKGEECGSASRTVGGKRLMPIRKSSHPSLSFYGGHFFAKEYHFAIALVMRYCLF
jgi:hypothetical protein